MRKILVWIVCLAVAFMVSGCAQMREKFIRKPKEVKKVPKQHYVMTADSVRPSLELYTKRYIFWKNWHRELLAVLGDENYKKVVVAAEQDLSNLIAMRNMLVDEKAEELQVLVDKMTKLEMDIKRRKATSGKAVRLRKDLEALGRQVRRNFSYNKMRGFIRNDWEK